jgi:hypothetical protein
MELRRYAELFSAHSDVVNRMHAAARDGDLGRMRALLRERRDINRELGELRARQPIREVIEILGAVPADVK